MGICRLCVQNENELHLHISEETLEILPKIVPHMNQSFLKNLYLCGVCDANIRAATTLWSSLVKTDLKIKEELEKHNLNKINLKAMYKNTPLKQECIDVCRICLKLLSCPRIFLCENSSNLLHHDVIKKMLKFCNIVLNFEISDKPVMCTGCWELLQISYSFKKNYLDVDQRIRQYCNKFRLQYRSLKDESLYQVKSYFTENCNDLIGDLKTEDNFPRYKFRFHSRVKEKLNLSKIVNKDETIMNAINVNYPVQKASKTAKIKFTKEEDLWLIKVYLEITVLAEKPNGEQWNTVYDWWNEYRPEKPVAIRMLRSRISTILKNNLLSNEELEKVKADVIAKLKTTTHLVLEESVSDSDDSFVDEAKHSNSEPHIKPEPLNESDLELNVIDNMEVESECESLPQLERMDNPAANTVIMDNYNIEDKRKALIVYMTQLEPCIDGKKVKSYRRSWNTKNSDDELFKCMQCSFETKFRNSADRHAKWHEKRKNKLYLCEECPYKISNKKLLNKHLKTHKDDNSIPVLLPSISL